MSAPERATRLAAPPQTGGRIRELRQKAGLTLQALADAAGISVGFLSQVERNKATPSLGTLAALAAALEVQVDWFVATPQPADAITRAGERPQLSIADSSLAYERLDTRLPGGRLSSLVIHIPEGYASEEMRHSGEEMVFVLEGRIRQRLGDAVMLLGPGDSLHFMGDTPHSFANIGPGPARLLWTGTTDRLVGHQPEGRPDRRHPMKLFRTALVASLLALATAPALANTPPNALVIAQNIDDIVTIDPATAFEFSSGEVVTNIYDQLVQYDATDLTTLAGGLAASWEIDAENRSITFTLREGVTFHSGNPLRAEDVLGSWRRALQINGRPAFILQNLGWTAENIDEMVTIEGNTVTVRWEGEFASSFVMNILASGPASIVDMETVMSHEVNGDLGHAWMNQNSAGTGPFSLVRYSPAEAVILRANPNYFGGAPAMEQILIRHVAEASTQRLLLESGDVDMARNLTPDQIAGLSGNDRVRVETYPQAAIHWISFNQLNDSLTNPAVWEAARWLVDYEGMTNSFLRGQMKVHQAFWPSGFPGSLTDTPFSYNPDRARQILADAGVELPITVTLDVINANPFNDIAQSLQQTFGQVGINFEILPGTGAQVITRYRARAHEAMLLFWSPSYMDPHANARSFAFNDNNAEDAYTPTTNWRNAWVPPAEINAMTLAALAEPDAERRLEMYLELQRAMQAEAPYVIMFQASNQVAMSPSVTGFVHGASSGFVYYRLVEKN